jgi:hypothetical protein
VSQRPTRFVKPVIKVYLLPSSWQVGDHQDYFDELLRAARSVASLRVASEKDLIVLFPKDAMAYDVSTEVVIEVDVPAHFILSEDQENEVVSAIFKVTQDLLPDVYIQCKLYKFGVEHGYYATGMDDE